MAIVRKIAVIGSGQAGLLAAHALLQAGQDVALYSDRSPEDWLERARPTGTAVRFARSLAYERRLGLTHGHDDAPRMDGLKVTICSHPARPLLALHGRFATSPKFTVFDGLGECYWTPYFHKDQKPVWNLVFEAKPGTPYDRFGAARSGHDVLDLAKHVIRDMMPWDFPWIEHATLADDHSWLVGAITPTVRSPIGRTPSRRPIVPLGDAYIAFDPLGAQGANIGNRLAEALTAAIVARGDQPFDHDWVHSVYEPFFTRWAAPAIRWTHLLLAPTGLAARYLLLAQEGADGTTLGGTPKQRIADAFAATFDDPITLADTLGNFRRTRRLVAELAGTANDWHVAKRFLAVGVRQLRNTLRA